MTQGMRSWRALGLGFGLLLGGLAGCMHPEKKPLTATRGTVGPATAGGTSPGVKPPVSAQPAGANPAGRTVPNAQSGAYAPSVLPPNTTTNTSFTSSAFDDGYRPQPGYTPAMSVTPRGTNPATMPLQPSMPAVTQHSAANYGSPSQVENGDRLATPSIPSGMAGASAIPANAGNLPQGPGMDYASGPMPPPAPTGGYAAAPGGGYAPASGYAPAPQTADRVMPPQPQEYGVIPPTPPATVQP